LFTVAAPFQLALRSNRSLVVRTFVGVVSGLVGVWLGLLVLSSYPISWEWYGSRVWALHVVFAGVGMCFAVLWHRRLRPNNSFKPTPLRGAT
jgi:ABC-type polysaccharide/polyol phosphate export permease